MLRHREGRNLLTQAINDLRAGRESMIRYKPGTEEPETFLGTGEPESWTGEAIREQFPTAHQAVTRAAPTEAELIRKLTDLIDGDHGVGALMDELEQLPGVRRHGLSKVLGAEVKSSLGDLAERLGYLIRAHDDQFASSVPAFMAPTENPAGEPTDGDDLDLDLDLAS